RSGDEQIDRYRNPDKAGSDRRDQRTGGHEHSPEQCALNTEHPENKPANRPLHQGDDEAALDRRDDDDEKLFAQYAALVRRQRDKLADFLDQTAPVAQQEESQIEHHAERKHQPEHALPDVECLGDDELQTFANRFFYPRAKGRKIPIAQLIKLGLQPVRKPALNVDKKPAKINRTGLYAGIGAGRLSHQRNAEQDQGHDHQQDNKDQRQCSRRIAARGEPAQYPFINRLKQHCDHHGPENRPEKRFDQQRKSQRNDKQKRQHKQPFDTILGAL